MIALISFKEDLIIPIEEAVKLKLEYTNCKRIGYNGSRLEEMNSSYYYYKDELEERVEDDRTVYYKGDEKITDYYIRRRPKEGVEYVKMKRENNLVDLEWFALNCKYPFYIEQCVKTEEPSMQNIQALLNKLEEKTIQLNKTIDIMQQQSFNQKCDVHVGGGLIVTYNDVMLKEDSCTDALQCELNNGWRMLAVCVQPDQRRPDYILGRYNPSLDVEIKDRASR